MAAYQILYWREIPSQVKAWDAAGERKQMLSNRFQMAIDAAAMASGSTESDDYLAGWEWGPVQERDGSAEEVLAAVVAELEQLGPKRARRTLGEEDPGTR